MRCPYHSGSEVIGYCTVCGEFGCEHCLTKHESALYCPRHYQPIGQRLKEERKHDEIRRKHPRQLLVARFMDGQILRGVCYALNANEPGFHLDLLDTNGVPLGKAETIRFQDLKAVFVVKSLDGNFDKAVRYKDWVAEGDDLVVEFKDGETIRGRTLKRYDADDARFYLVPAEESGNNISVLVESKAVGGIYTPDQYKEKKLKERETQREQASSTPPSQEETLGDFYIEIRDYGSALDQYRAAMAKSPDSLRLKKKAVMAQYNVGVQYIKRRDYAKALACMEAGLKIDPKNEHALKKVSQLRHILEKEGKSREASEGPSQ